MRKKISGLLFIVLAACSSQANALLIKLDFTSIGSGDLWGNITNNLDPSQATGLSSSFISLTNNILGAVEADFHNNTDYGFIGINQRLDINFAIASHATDMSGVDANNYTIQIGSRVSGPHNGFGVACLGCVSNSTVAPNTIFGSIFSNNIFGALTGAAGGAWDLTEAVNAIAGTVSHEIGHSLDLLHPSGPQANPGDSIFGLMATGASPAFMPNGERLVDRAFSFENMQGLVNNIGLKTIQPPVPVPEPSGLWLSLVAILTMLRVRSISS
jgi:hypothetical protein